MSAPPPHLDAFGRTVRKARRDRDLSQEALADRAGLNAKHLGEIERANKDPRLTTVVKLARALDLRPGELFTLSDARVDAAEASAERGEQKHANAPALPG